VTNFGPIIHPVMVDNAVLDHLKLWLPTQLHQMEREEGLAAGSYLRLPPHDSCYSNVYDESQYVDNRIPSILVITGGTPTVERHGDGTYSALWDVLVSAIVRSVNDSDVRLVASLYGAAVWRTIMQHASLGGFASGVAWQGAMPLVPLSGTVDRGRHILVAQSRWLVYTDGVVSDRDGPVDPDPLPDPTTPYPPDSTVIETDVEIDRLDLP
jgi:hypothetical protein